MDKPIVFGNSKAKKDYNPPEIKSSMDSIVKNKVIVNSVFASNSKLAGVPNISQPFSYSVDSIRCYDPGTTIDLKFDGWIKLKINGTEIKVPFKIA
jgi:hypothetical protein